jgi:hypothetical protein
VFPHFVSPNEFTRWLLAASIVENRGIEVSALAPMLGPRFEDLSVIDGRTYSNKPPGLALVTLPAYLAARMLHGPPSPDNLRPVLSAMRVAGATLPVFLLALLFLRIAREKGISDERRAVVLVALLLATPLFTYSLLLFSHALVAACLFGAWAALFQFRGKSWSEVVAGALIGLATVCEYPAIVPGAVLVLASIERRDPARVIRLIAGGIPFALLLAWYQRAAFGGVFELTYMYEKVESYRAAAREGIGPPSPARILRLLGDPSKGLFIFSPILLYGVFAFRDARQALERRAWVALWLVPLAILLFAAGYRNWHGGWTVGPRYIVGAIPFLVFPLLFRRTSMLEAFTLGYSVVAVAVTTLVFPFVPGDFALPWGSFALPLIKRMLVVPNVFHLTGLDALKFIPIAAAVASAFVPFTRRLAISAAGGVLIAIVIGLFAEARHQDLPRQRLELGYIAEVYFDDRGALAEGAEPRTVPRSLIRRSIYERELPPAGWPF